MAGHGIALADFVERRLDVVGERRRVIETEHRTRPLDCVQGAKSGIEQPPVFRGTLKVEQRGFKLSQEILRFLLKYFSRIVCFHCPKTFLATESNSFGSNGFVTQAVAPAAFACAFLSASPTVVTKTIGTPA